MIKKYSKANDNRKEHENLSGDDLNEYYGENVEKDNWATSTEHMASLF